MIHQRVREQPLIYCVGAATHPNTFVSWCPAFDPKVGFLKKFFTLDLCGRQLCTLVLWRPVFYQKVGGNAATDPNIFFCILVPSL